MKRIGILLLLLLQLVIHSEGQSGAYIYSRYNTTTFWNETLFPPPTNGKIFQYKSADTVSTEWNALIMSIFKFSPSHYVPSMLDSIKTLQGFTNVDSLNATYNYYFSLNPNQAFKQLNPARSYSFSLNQIVDTAYTTFTPKSGPIASADTEICFFIIPGSGDNQTAALLRNEGYHNINCNVVNTLKKHGDVYVFVKPNEDFRAIRIQQLPTKKMVTDVYPTDSYLNQYLISNYKHEGINYLIECVAAIKQLKQQYKKVFLLGCSQGGYAALYAALETEVDGILVSSGYSVKLDDNYLNYGNMAQKFAQLPFLLLKDSIKTKISQQKSTYFFSWPTNDSPIYLAENQFHHTENYFNQGMPLNNVKYLYTYADHAFPPCVYIDSFVREVKMRPKAFVTDTLNACLYDSMVRRVVLTGQAPFTYDLYRNDTLIGSYSSTQHTDTLVFYNAGIYQLKNIMDANATSGIWSEHIKYSKAPNASLQIVSKVFHCDSLYTKVSIAFQGTAPFQLTTSRYDSVGNLNVFNQQVLSNSNVQLNLPNGKYLFTGSDAVACELLIDSVQVLDSAIHYQWLSEQYDCAQHQSQFQFQLEGRSPFVVQYYKDGNVNNVSTSAQQNNWWLNNGHYFISQIKDSNNCVFTVNQQVDIAYDSLIVTSTMPDYQCDDNTAVIDYHLQGNSPFVYTYLINGSTQMFTIMNDTSIAYGNGTLEQMQVTDATGCLYLFSTPPYTFATDTFKAIFSAPVFDCDSVKYRIHFDLSGNPPYTLFYQKNGINDQLVTSQNSFDWYVDNGNYLIQKIKDAKGCEKDTNQVYLFNSQAVDAAIIQEEYMCDSVKFNIKLQLNGFSPWQLSYTNGISQLTQSMSTSLYALMLGNGDYSLMQVTDAMGCAYTFASNNYHFSYDTLECTIDPPIFDCDSNKNKLHFTFEGNPPFTIQYLENLINTQVTTNQYSYDLYLQNGNYVIQQLLDSSGCSIDTSLFYNFNQQPISASIISNEYHCDSNKYQLMFAMTGNAPWQIHYTDGLNSFVKTSFNSSSELLLENGNWTVTHVSDVTGCIVPVNQSFSCNYAPITGSIMGQSYDCDSAKLKVQFYLTGNAPWVIHYVRNGAVPEYINDTTNNPFESIYLSNGTYTLLEITDVTNCQVTLMQAVVSNLSPLDLQQVGTSFDCDSSKMKVDFMASGNGPWLVMYQDISNSIFYNYVSNTPLFSLYFGNGDYVISGIQDANCIQLRNDTLYVNHPPLIAQVLDKVIDCDSAKYMVRLVSHGGVKPYTYNYFLNGNLQSVSTFSDTTVLYLTQGNYLFQDVIDSIGCSYSLNHYVEGAYHNFSFNGLSEKYLCDKDSTQVNFNITHTAPVWLVYANDLSNIDTLFIDGNSTMNLSNGNYSVISIFDSLKCVKAVNESLMIQHEAIDFNLLGITKDCANDEYVFSFQVKGDAPWRMLYNHQNILDTLLISSKQFDWHTTEGMYYLINIMDHNDCELMIQLSDTLDPFLTKQPMIKLKAGRIFTIDLAYQYAWYKNNVLIDTTSGSSLAQQGEGNYFVILSDTSGCNVQSNSIHVPFSNGITAYPNPTTSTSHVVLTEFYGRYWDYMLTDMLGNKLMDGSEEESFKDFDLSHLKSGVYNLFIMYEEDFSKHVIRLIKYD